jgi:PIN domain nuclease of toxin-antitoxin system
LRYLLDTVTFLWAATSPEKLSRKVNDMLANRADVREISALSLSEIAIKNSVGKLTFSKADVTTGLSDLRVRVLPFSFDHALEFFDLPPHHSDPFDRQIIAQALSEDIPVVTCDDRFRLYHGLKVIW